MVKDYQTRKEQLYLQALGLTLDRHRFAPIFSAGEVVAIDQFSDQSRVASATTTGGFGMLFRGGGDHTWKANDEDFIAASIRRWDGYQPDVISTQTDPR